MSGDIVILARHEDRSEWGLISNPKESDIQAALMYLYNEFNDYVEHKNCGVIYRAIRIVDLPKYVSTSTATETAGKRKRK
jgi:hypothetical protein